MRADLRALPVGDGLVDAAACLWVLYHFQRPVQVLREAERVLCAQGWFVASTSARTNDLELASLLPGWGRPGTVDAEDARQIVEQVFDEVDLESWDAPLIHLPARPSQQGPNQTVSPGPTEVDTRSNCSSADGGSSPPQLEPAPSN